MLGIQTALRKVNRAYWNSHVWLPVSSGRATGGRKGEEGARAGQQARGKGVHARWTENVVEGN